MNIRKFFGIPSILQERQIEQDEKLIMERCDVIARAEMEDQQMAKKSRDGQCPHCKAKGMEIVDKICHVQGKSNGKFRLGFGTVGVLVDTEAVNHCNACGNEWKKFKTKEISQTHIIRLSFKYLCEVLSNPKVKKDWKMEAIAVFDGCTAESIFSLRIDHSDYLKDEINDKLTLSRLRKYYRSVYDASESVKLEKI
jgi:hypothetical protein